MKRSGGCDGFMCVLGCLSLVPGFRKKLVSRAAFFPPSPPGYSLSGESGAAETTILLNLLNRGLCSDIRWKPLEMPKIDQTEHGIINIKHHEIPTRDKNLLQAFHFQRYDSSHTIIFAHGNSTDIGLMFPHLLEMCRLLEVDILAFDYSGYGISTGQPSEDSLYSNIAAVFEFVTGPELQLNPQQLILFGQSVGSAAVIDLASKIPGIAGIIIHAGIMSGLTVLKSDYDYIHWFDVFKNIEKIKIIQCPIYIIHGECDLEVNIKHGQNLYQAAPNAWSWWVPNAGHNDIEIVHRAEYFNRLASFLRFIGAKTTNKMLSSQFREEERKINKSLFSKKKSISVASTDIVD